MRHSLITSLTTLYLSVLTAPVYADQFVENVIRECVKYEFAKVEDQYTTVTEIQEAHKSINHTCTRNISSACRDHNSQSCVSSINRYRGNEPERRYYSPNRTNKQITVIHTNKDKKSKADLYRSQPR